MKLNMVQRKKEGSIKMFRVFIREISMMEVGHKGRDWTWANNREGESFVKERLYRLFASLEWIYQFPKAIVQHVQKQASDNCLLILEDKPLSQHISKRFYFDKRILEVPAFKEEVKKLRIHINKVPSSKYMQELRIVE